jgi:RNA polymerase sigma factor (sigma-70 family)
MAELEDFQAMLRRVQEGSDDAAWQLVERYGETIRRAVRRALAAPLRSKFDSLDFVQLVWSSFFRGRDRLERFDHPNQLVAFLAVMARNKVGMEVRRRLSTGKRDLRRERSLDESAMELADRQPAPIDVAIAREQWNRMLVGQPEHYRQIVHLRLQGHTYQEIADSLCIAESTVRRFLQKLLLERVS